MPSHSQTQRLMLLRLGCSIANMRKKHLHFVGIGGTAMAALARAFKAAGCRITGSEALGRPFPPISTYLQKNKIKYYSGFNSKKVGQPDEIITGNAFMSFKNSEIIYARKNHIPLRHYPHLIEKHLVKKNSVVVAGACGKSTITSMTAWLLDQSRKNPNYMVGGIPLNFGHGAQLTNSSWSVIEGDEYPAASPWDCSPKFDYYHPKYLILTSAAWDHQDIYTSQASYLRIFQNLVGNMPKHGLIVANLNGDNIKQVLKKAPCRIIFYSLGRPQTKQKNIYHINDIKRNKTRIKFSLKKDGEIISVFETSLLGRFNLENWAAVLALASELKIPIKKTKEAVKTFKGVKRRLEIKHKDKITIIDDLAHSPIKARAAIETLKENFPNNRVFVVFEPNRGSRILKNLRAYDFVFKNTFKTFIPQLTQYTNKAKFKEASGLQLAAYLKKTHRNVSFQPDQQKIINFILKNSRTGDVAAFLGSKNFDALIQALIKSFD